MSLLLLPNWTSKLIALLKEVIDCVAEAAVKEAEAKVAASRDTYMLYHML